MSNVSEGKICRSIIDRHDVMKNQVMQAVREALGANPDPETLRLVSNEITRIFQSQTSGLISTVSHQFSGKG